MNKTAQFTPGPRIERTPGNWAVQHNNNDDTTYIVANDPRLGDDMVAEIYRVSAYEGNANLIAAAPVMYEALKTLVEYLSTQVPADALDDWKPVFAARQALAQAEGRQA